MRNPEKAKKMYYGIQGQQVSRICVENMYFTKYLSSKVEGEEKLFALESFLSVFTSLFCLQTLDMT